MRSALCVIACHRQDRYKQQLASIDHRHRHAVAESSKNVQCLQVSRHCSGAASYSATVLCLRFPSASLHDLFDLSKAGPAYMFARDSEGAAHTHTQAQLCQLRFVPTGLACMPLSAWLPCSWSVGLHASSRPSLPQLPEQWVARVQLGPSIRSRQPSCLIGLPGHQQGTGKPLGQSTTRSAWACGGQARQERQHAAMHRHYLILS